MIASKIALLFAVCVSYSDLAVGFESKLLETDTVIISEGVEDLVFKFPEKIITFKVKIVKDLNLNSAFIVLVKSKVRKSGDIKWYFQFRGFFGSSTGAVELGVSPPSESEISEIKYLYGDTFGFKFLDHTDKEKIADWYYVTSCPPRSGKDHIGAFLHPKAEEMMK